MGDGSASPTLESRVAALERELKGAGGESRSMSIICFSCEYDKLYAAFNLAVGGAAMGISVDVFFTFWGAAAMEKYIGGSCKRSVLQRFMSFLLPKDVNRLPLSRMNFLGLGRRMMQRLMGKKNIEDLSQMIENARELGVRFHLCKKSSEIIGMTVCAHENVDECGVSGFLSNALKNRLVMFI